MAFQNKQQPGWSGVWWAADAEPLVFTASFESPQNAQQAVSLSSSIYAAFTLPVDSATVSNATFFVSSSAAGVAGALNVNNYVVQFTPTNLLLPLTTYTVTVTTDVADVNEGATMSQNFLWSFTTGPGYTMRAWVAASSSMVYWSAPTQDPLGYYWSGNPPFSALSDVVVL